MNLAHALKWHETAKMYRCRLGACNFEVTKDRLVEAGYHPHTEGVVFVDEVDFGEGGDE